MPIYEYVCPDCHQQVNLLFRTFAAVDTKPVICPECGSSNLERIMSQVTVVQGSGASQTGSVNQPADDQHDPKALANSMREAGQGRDLGPEFKEVITRLEAGEKPVAIENSLRKRFGQNPQTH